MVSVRLQALAVAGAALAVSLGAWAVGRAQQPQAPAAADLRPTLATAEATAATPAALPSRPQPFEMARLREAIAAAESGRWDEVRRQRDIGGDPLVRNLIAWRFASDTRSPASFNELRDALVQLDGWPSRDTIRRRAEQMLLESGLSAGERIAFLRSNGAPLSGDGQMGLALALAELGQRGDAVAIAREAWRERNLNPRAEAAALAAFDRDFTRQDHADRVDRLLWRDQRGDAMRLLPRLSPEDRLLADARIALQQRRSKGLQALVNAVPASRRNDPGFLWDRARYTRRAGRPEDALPVIARVRADDAAPSVREELFEERRLYISRSLRGGDRQQAYRLAADHGLSQGEAFADGEWLAGWISLRFLSNPGQALEHFSRLDANVRTPVSRARALYWRAQAERALGRGAEADRSLDAAAQLDFTYYGQLAAQQRNPAALISLGDPPAIDPIARVAFENRELVRALRLLAEVGDQRDFESIAFFLDDQLTTQAEHEMLAAIAREQNYPRTAVRSAKAGMRRGIVAQEAAYPTMPLPADARQSGRPEAALIHAITRQESEFDPRAVSPVGARGLMQLMPATAQATARRHGFVYDRARLMDDPNYNISLGAAHLQDLLSEFNGSYIMTIAAYNAGSSRPRQWMEDWGDPRTGAIDPVDWVELIPFAETRNYVMRVMENLQVYRHRLNRTPTRITLKEDLRRGG
jgi:soluble lytic murein transglycosylase